MSGVNVMIFSQISFLLLSLLSGIIELGGIFYGFKMNLSNISIIMIALVYQLGNLFPIPFKLNRLTLLILSLINFILIINYIANPNFVSYISIFFLTTSIIQSLRAESKNDVSTELKRTFRIFGFLISYLFNFKFLISINIMIFIFIFFNKEKNKITYFFPKNKKKLGKIMIFHQLHYFSYVYILLIIFYYNYSLNLLKIGISFSISWIVYTSISIFITSKNYKKIFIIGHLYLGILLFSLAFIDSIYLVNLFWILSGIGGGTVFCIKKLSKDKLEPNEVIFYENMGHILGVLISLGFTLKYSNLKYIFFISSCFALIACILMIKYKENNHE